MPPTEPQPTETESVRLGALSLPARLIVGAALAGLGGFFAWHLAAVFLFVAPDNTITNEHGKTIQDYVYPEFEQNWQLFAPNPLQRDVAVQVRAEIRDDGAGPPRNTEWIDLTAMDIAHIEHNLVPSHTAQNELRRAWDFYAGTLDDDGEPSGLRGELAEAYVHRIALHRLADRLNLGDVNRIQMRSVTTLLPAPEFSGEELDTTPSYHLLDWWVVTTEDLPDGVLAAGSEEGRR